MVGDETRVKQILFNLLSNAAKFTSNGEVSFSARQMGTQRKPEIEFRVADTGIGMTLEQLATLFDPSCKPMNRSLRPMEARVLGWR